MRPGQAEEEDPFEEEREKFIAEVARAPSMATALLWAHENKDSLQAAMQAVREDRLYELMGSVDGRRAHDDLSRALYRAMAELRKQQDWRLRRPIDFANENHSSGDGS